MNVSSCWMIAFLAAPVLSAAVQSADAPAGDPVVQAGMNLVDATLKPEHYDFVRVDLNGDQHDEALVLTKAGSSFNGTGGGTLSILSLRLGQLIQTGLIPAVQRPVYLRKTSHKGMRDLLVTRSGGGARPGVSALAYNGRTYQPDTGKDASTLRKDDTLLFDVLPPAAFAATESLHGITFKVSSPNTPTHNTVTITPAGLEKDNSPVTSNVKGVVLRAEVADINSDGSPEIYVHTVETDASAAAGLIAFSANQKKSLSHISLPSLRDDAKNSTGYRGHDEMAVVEGIIARRFPIYPEDTLKSEPTGKMRQLQYKLHAGEAGWLLTLDKVVEF